MTGRAYFLGLCVFICTALLPVMSIASPTEYDLPVTGWSKDPEIEVFDKKIIALMKKWRIPGGAVAIMKNEQLITTRGYGWADQSTHRPVQPGDLFRIASASKTFTAVAILKLIEQGRLGLEDKAFDILSDLKPLPNRTVNPQIHQITVRNLLQMSSGWFTRGAQFDPLFGPWSGKIRETLAPELPASCQTIARYMMSAPIKHKPGTHYSYSNTDYCVLGLIINKVTGSPYGYQGYEDYVNRAILYPLNIRDMFIGSTQLAYKAPREVIYYRDEKSASPEELENSFYLPYGDTELLKKNFANGGWVSSAQDLALFIQKLGNNRILNAESIALMKTKPSFRPAEAKTYYTIGGQIYHNQAGKEYWIQTGSFTGTNAFVLTTPEGITIAVLFNSRPSIYNFLSQFRPELRKLVLSY